MDWKIHKERKIDGENISEESREAYKQAVNNSNWEKAHKILYEILTGEKLEVN